MTFCMNVSRFMNLAAIFSFDLESQFMHPDAEGGEEGVLPPGHTQEHLLQPAH